MKIGIMQPYFFPYIGYWQLINAVDKFVIYDDVNFIKNGWINRNYILLNGQKHLITLPLQRVSSFQQINNIDIICNQKIKDKLLKTIYTAYSKANYFKQVFPIIENTINHESGNIATAIKYSIQAIVSYLNIQTEILLSSNIKKDISLKGENKVINIIKQTGGNEYINAIGGQNLYNRESFLDNGISLYFIHTNENINYAQFRNNFVPNLSIIDIIMFNSVKDVKELLNDYELL